MTRNNKWTFKRRIFENSIEAFGTKLSGVNWYDILDSVSSSKNLANVNILYEAVLEIAKWAFFTVFPLPPVKAFGCKNKKKLCLMVSVYLESGKKN